MRGIIAGSVGLALGLGGARAMADDTAWKPGTPAPAVWGAPVAAQQPATAAPLAALGAPLATLAAPRPIAAVPRRDAALRPVSAVARAQNSDGTAPMPPGPMMPSIGGEPEKIGAPRQMPTVPAPDFPGTPMMPGAGTPGPMMSGPVDVSPVPYTPAPCANCVGDLPPLPGGTYLGDTFGAGGGSRWYASGEYLLWWTKGGTTPPLLSTSGQTPTTYNGVAVLPSGILTLPTSQVLYGDGPTHDTNHSGARFNAGYWFDDCEHLGIDAGYFFLGTRTSTYDVASSGMPGSLLIARPIIVGNMIPPGLTGGQIPAVGGGTITVGPGQETSEIVAANGIAGAAKVSITNNLWGADLNLRQRLFTGCSWHTDLVGGFRFLQFDETLTVDESSRLLATPTNPMAIASDFVHDQFQVNNQFYGGQIGALTSWQRGRWSLDLMTKVALGLSHEIVNIDGYQVVTNAGGMSTSQPGGALALASNIGSHTTNKFAVVPEVGFNLGYQVTPHVKLIVGYNFLYWSSVLRAGEQVDRVVDVNTIPNFGVKPGVLPPVNRPLVPLKDTDFWAQGINFGVQVKW